MTLLAELTAAALERDAERGWVREQVDELPEQRDPDLLRPWKRAYMANDAVTVVDRRSRRVVGNEVSPGEVSRIYLRRLMGLAAEETGRAMLARNVPWRRDALALLDRRPAYYFAGQRGGPFALVDIDACYASIYTRLSLDMTYRPECSPPLIGVGRVTFRRSDEWLREKHPRNAMWGNLLRPRVREWRHGQAVDDALPNRYFAPDLSALVFDVAHSISVVAVETFGAISWAVDGGLFTPDAGAAFIGWLWETWGLSASIRADGPGWAFGPTSWRVGDQATQDVANGRAHQWQPVDRLRRSPAGLTSRLAGIVKERKP